MLHCESITTMSSSSYQVQRPEPAMSFSDLAKSINGAADGPAAFKEEERMELLQACENLKRALESPLDATIRIIFGGHRAMMLRLAVEMKLFDVVAETHDDEIRVDQLAVVTGADHSLIKRIMRVLAGMGIFKEVRHDTFAPTPLAGAYVTGSPLADGVIHVTSKMAILSRLPEYFEERGFRDPIDAFDGPFQYAMGTKLHYFDWLQSYPKDQKAFNTVMGISRLNRGEEWYEYYPVEEQLRATGSEPLLVDVGGGLGHDLIAFKQEFPHLRGRLIVQDLPVVIDDVKELPSGIEAMKHDFFKPQPIRNAKAYYLRTVLHDWPDKQAREILSNIRGAMSKHSILLINENALPDDNVPLYPAELDISMLVLFSSLDRTQLQFEELLESAGFELVKIWTPKVMVPGSGTLFEAVLKQ